MAGFVERAVLRLREDARFSRNRHYLALSSPEGQRALRIHRHLRSLERDLTSGCTAAVEHTPAGVRLVLSLPRARRTAILTLAEFRLLCTSPLVRAVLGEAAASA